MPKSLDRGPEHPWPTHFEREKVLSETKIEKGKNDFFFRRMGETREDCNEKIQQPLPRKVDAMLFLIFGKE